MPPYIKDNPEDFHRTMHVGKETYPATGVKFFPTPAEANAFALFLRKKMQVRAGSRAIKESFTSGGYIGGRETRYLVLVYDEHLLSKMLQVHKAIKMWDLRKLKTSYYSKE